MATQTSKKATQETAKAAKAAKTETRSRLTVPARLVELQKRSLERQRSAFDTTFQAVQSFQEGRESAIHSLLESSSFVPREWREIADAWIGTARQNRESFRQTVDTTFVLAERFVERLGEREAAKA